VQSGHIHARNGYSPSWLVVDANAEIDEVGVRKLEAGRSIQLLLNFGRFSRFGSVGGRCNGLVGKRVYLPQAETRCCGVLACICLEQIQLNANACLSDQGL